MQSSRTLAFVLAVGLTWSSTETGVLAQGLGTPGPVQESADAAVQHGGSEVWDHVLALQPDQRLQVRLDLRDGTLRGTFVAADSGSLTIRVNGTSGMFRMRPSDTE